jgi:hypothetical protein
VALEVTTIEVFAGQVHIDYFKGVGSLFFTYELAFASSAAIVIMNG